VNYYVIYTDSYYLRINDLAKLVPYKKIALNHTG